MRRTAVIGALLLALSGVVAGTSGASARAETSAVRLPGLEQGIFSKVNQLRRSRGLATLTVSPALDASAVMHSKAMAAGGFFAHSSADGTPFSDRIKRFYPPMPGSAWSVGENLLYNTAAVDANAALASWLASPPHREILLGVRWREVGIGAVRAPSSAGTFSEGPVWIITMDFGARGSVPSRTLAKPRPK